MKKNNKGFSLIDVVCAAAILALVALPICSGFLTAAKSNQRIHQKAEIVTMLDNELSLITTTGKATGLKNVADLSDLADVVFDENTVGGSYKKIISDKTILIVLDPVNSLRGDDSLAYIEVTLTYDNETVDDASDDVILEGVWIPRKAVAVS